MAAEKQLELKIKEYIKKCGGYCEKIHGSEFQQGIADLICCYKGKFIALEIKAPHGKASPLQIKKLRQVRDSGGIGIIVYSLDQVVDLVYCINNDIDYKQGVLF